VNITTGELIILKHKKAYFINLNTNFCLFSTAGTLRNVAPSFSIVWHRKGKRIYGSNNPEGQPSLYDEINKHKNKKKFFMDLDVCGFTWYT
jgi:hypothetical protein